MEMLDNSNSLDREGSDIELGVNMMTSLPSCHDNGAFSSFCNMSIDEPMIKVDGWLSWKQYMPKKPVK